MGKAVEIRISQLEPKGVYILELYYNGRFIKKIAECYEESYANLIASKLEQGVE